MRRIIRFLWLVFIVFLVIAQFIRPEKNAGIVGDSHIFNQADLTEEMKQKLQHACLDCHSDQTDYPWYSQIAPVSWMMSSHIKEGKKSLNFSEWGNFSNFDKIAALDEVYAEVKEGKMPLRSYSLIHKNARLTQSERDEISSWADKLASKLMETENKQ